jgi:nucleoside-diphosphate-sugar epimerase
MGESICLAFDNPKIRIARLSNVSGFNHTSNLFLPSIIRDAVDKKNINLSIKLESEKDYVHIDDVVKVLPEIALNGKYRIYNVAKGENTTNQDIITKLQQITSCKLDILEGAKNYSFPKINTERIVNEFNFNSKSVLNYIDDIVGSYKNFKNKN